MSTNLPHDALMDPTQCELVIRGLPKAQAHKTLIQKRIKPWPKGLDDILPSGWPILEILDLKIQMLVAPWLYRLGHRVLERRKIDQSAAPFVKRPANRCFGKITMAMPTQIVAFTLKLKVFFCGELISMQAMGSAKRNLHPKIVLSSTPIFRKEIRALV